MSVSISDPTGAKQAEVDATPDALRTIIYGPDGNPLGTAANPLVADARPALLLPGSVAAYGASSFRTVGTVATAQPLATVRNNGGAKDIVIRRIAVECSVSAAAVFLTNAYFRIWMATGVTPSGGTAPTKTKLDSGYAASQAGTEILFGASADGTNTNITHATPGGTPVRQRAHANVLTAVGEATNNQEYTLQDEGQHPLVIPSGEVMALILVLSANNIATNHYTVKMVWEE